jgi:large conductance mechanosensitive channel
MNMADEVQKRARGFFSEFWKFAAKGNVFDLAVAVVVGTAFTAVVNGLVADFLLPILSLLTGNINLTDFSYTLAIPAATPVVLKYGAFLQVFLNFLIVALAVFVMFRFIQRMRERIAGKDEPPEPPVSNEEKLLTEIRDLLKARQ